MRLAGLRGASRNALKLRQPRSRQNGLSSRSFTTAFRLQQEFAATAVHNGTPGLKANGALEPEGKRIAILGGGITGLATAHKLLAALPNAKITIYEASKRLGGWIDSEKIQVEGGHVIFEWGPRNIRPDLNGAGHATALLLEQLQIQDVMVGISKRAPAATNRFLYYPDHLVRIPGPVLGGWFSQMRNLYYSLAAFLIEPVFSGAWRAIFKEPLVDVRSSSVEDESVGDFIRRRFGPSIADNLVSAMFHGIYAGDIYKLSARTLLPQLWYLETRDPEGQGILPELYELLWNQRALVPEQYVKHKEATGNDAEIDVRLLAFLMNLSVYTFSGGLSQLVSSLEVALRKSTNVIIKPNAPVTGLKFDKGAKTITIQSTDSSPSNSYDYVVSSLPPEILRTSVPSTSTASAHSKPNTFDTACTSANDASTVMVVNLYYSNPDLIPPQARGFGYLLPRSLPLEQNPERALGVIFGSESSGPRGPAATGKFSDLDKGLNMAIAEARKKAEARLSAEQLKALDAKAQKMMEYAETTRLRAEEAMKKVPIKLPVGQDTARGTKLTVMLGGHWWDGWGEDDIPTPALAIQMSKDLLARHLGIVEEPEVAKARLAKSAIPQYRVGYRKTMHTIHRALLAQYEGRLMVAGPWWQGGVGINDCVRKAHMAALEIKKSVLNNAHVVTGLEDYGEEEQWYLVDRKSKTMTLDDP